MALDPKPKTPNPDDVTLWAYDPPLPDIEPHTRSLHVGYSSMVTSLKYGPFRGPDYKAALLISDTQEGAIV